MPNDPSALPHFSKPHQGACERCWRDAHERAAVDPSQSVMEHYMDLLKEREKHPCLESEQRGEDA
jgi:hypothetical protein